MPKRSTGPPKFVMWRSIPKNEQLGWERHWFGNELDPSAVFNVRGLGLREPMFNADVFRPIGTGDWLIMFFHEPARLKRRRAEPSVRARTLILWPPGIEQFYSWGKKANVEPHSWMHVEGTWVSQQVEENRLQTATPISLDDESLVTNAIQSLMIEMVSNEEPDPIILQNHFQNWARSMARHLETRDPHRQIPKALLEVRAHLDDHFAETPELDLLARLARMSRSHLCHQFRRHFKTTISSYVVRKRMSIAQRLLYDLELRPGEIAKEVGYPDIYQFSKQFKKTFGVSPMNYRKQHMPTESRS
jgi:AraC-like DNA-binding protein